MSEQLRHEVTMVVNGESRKVMVDADPQPAEAAPQAQEPKPAAAPKPVAKKVVAKSAAPAQKPTLLQRAKAAVTGKGKKA